MKNCQSPTHALAIPFVGKWEEYTVRGEEEILEGTLETQLELGGCALTQRFSSVDGSFSFFSFGYVDQTSGLWPETYVFNNGRATHWQWHEAGEEIVIAQVKGTGDARRLRVANMTADAYDVIEERQTSPESGWEFVELTRTKRIG